MKLSRYAALACVPALAIATVLAGDAAQAAGTTTAGSNASQPMTLEFHPLRASPAAKRAGSSLKPSLDKAAALPVNADLRMHVHADGAVSYECSENHAEVSTADAAEQPQ